MKQIKLSPVWVTIVVTLLLASISAACYMGIVKADTDTNTETIKYIEDRLIVLEDSIPRTEVRLEEIQKDVLEIKADIKDLIHRGE